MLNKLHIVALSAALLFGGLASAEEFQVKTVPPTSSQNLDVATIEPDTITPFSSAPPLTAFYNVVCSALVGGCEQVANGGTTAYKHGGSYIYVYIWEIGYGVGEIASQGGNSLTSAYLLGKYPICTSSTGYTTTCPAGSLVVGFQYAWNVTHYVEGNYGGLFAAQDTSINSPFNTIRSSFTIQH